MDFVEFPTSNQELSPPPQPVPDAKTVNPLDDISNKLNRLSMESAFEPDRMRAFAALEEAGIIEINGPDIVVDIQAICNDVNYKQLAPQLGVFSRGTDGRKIRDKITTFYELFNGVDVLSKEDFEKRSRGQEVKPKPLFYVPESASAAIDPEKIAQAEFYVGLWQLGSNVFPETYPTRAQESNSTLTPHEAIVAALIFHPQFGNATRGVDGKLIVTAKDGTRKPISADFFRSWHYSGGPHVKELPLLSRPAEFFAQRTPHLVALGHVMPEQDFRVVSGTTTERRVGYGVREPNNKGLVMLDGQRYTLGIQYAAKNGYAVTKIGDHLAGIIKRAHNGDEYVDAVFDLVTFGRTRPGSTLIKKDDVSVRSITMLDELSEEALLARNMTDLLQFNKEFVRDTGESLLSLSQTERVYALGVYLQVGNRPEFADFIRTHKKDGLMALMLSRGNIQALTDVLAVGKIQGASRIFQEASQIFSSIAHAREQVNGEHADEVMSVLTEHASNLVRSAKAAHDGTIAGVDVHDAITTIVSFRKSITHDTNIRYQRLLGLAEEKKEDSHVQALLLDMIQADWKADITRESLTGEHKQEHVVAAIEQFYGGNQELFDSASETTGDTAQELARWQAYAQREQINGVLADLGCGVGRLTTHKARMLGERVKIVGIDLLPPRNESGHDNLTYVQGNLTSIPLPNNSVDAADADWSVFNDATLRGQQLSMFSEITRILKTGGLLRFDVPHLEGGQGSWFDAAQEYHRTHPTEPFGMIEADFPGGRKTFHIYPQAELEALLVSHGFVVAKKDAWQTSAGKPRMTYEARLERKVTPLRLTSTHRGQA